MTVQQLIETLQHLADEGYANIEVRGEHYYVEEVVVSSDRDMIILH